MRVACFSPYPAEGPSVRHRILKFADIWHEQGIDLTLYAFMTSRFYAIRRRFGVLATLEKLFWMALCTVRTLVRALGAGRFDAVIIHREAYPVGPAWVERLICRLARVTFLDLDDATWAPPSDAIDQRRGLSSADKVPDTMRSVDCVVGGNATIAEYARRHNDRVEILPTSFEDLGPVAPRDGEAPPVIVWIGNLGNAKYFSLVQGVFEQLARRHRFVLRIIGGEDARQLRFDGVQVDFHHWSAATERELLTSSDIGVMPVFDAPYERGKCAFKIIQYWSAGLPVVASPVGMNADIVAPGQNGYLASAPEEWVRELDRLLASAALRRQLGDGGRQLFLTRFERRVCAERWLELLGNKPDSMANA
jgi:glycosyltransferase involved in cell wall biosynthesis